MTHYSYDLKLEPDSLEGSIPGHFTVIVHNKSYLEFPIKLFASDERQRARYELMPSVLSVPPGAKVRSHLLVVPTDITVFLQAIEFTVQDSFGKAVKGEYSPELEDDEEKESNSSEKNSESNAQKARDRGSDAPTRLHASARVGRQRGSYGGRRSPISLPTDTTIRVLMGMAAFLLIFLVVTISVWLWRTPSFVLSQPPKVTQTIEPIATKVSVSIPSPTATPPIATATPPIATVTLITGGIETQTPIDTPIEASLTPTDTPEGSLIPTNIPVEASLTPTNIPVEASLTPTNTPVRAISPTNTPVEASLTPTNTPVRASLTPTNTPVRASLTPTNTPVRASLTPTNTPEASLTPTNTPEASLTPTNTPVRAVINTLTPTPVPPTNTPTPTAVPPTNTPTLTAVPPTNTPTVTAVPPTDTPTVTAVPPTDTPTLTSVPPTDTPTITPTVTPQLTSPDLMITSLEVTGSPVQTKDGSFQVPILVIIQNQGESPSDIFKVAIDATQSQGTFVVPFTVNGQSSIWYPFTSAPLAADSRVLFEGTVTLNSSPSGEAVTLTAIADSCSGDELMPDYCRVEESNEQNNRTASATIRLP